MSAGARPGTLLVEIQEQFTRITGANLFAFSHWYAEQMRSLRALTEASFGQWPHLRAEQEKLLLEVLKATPRRTQ